MRRAAGAMMVLAFAGAVSAQDGAIAYPHPVITEVLFGVPSEALGGDANQDGARDPIGDEFVELYNPHDRAIDLSGYTVGDSYPDARHRLEFAFPKGARLGPGQCVVVFNGFRQQDAMPKPYGDRRTLASGPNKAFGGALVYSIKNISGTRAWANTDDAVVVRDPEGNVIELVVWGEPESLPVQEPMRRARVDADAPFSFQRLGPWGELVPHLEIDGRRFSPGEIPEPTEGDRTPK